MHLVIDHVSQLDHVDHTDSRRLVEPLTCSAVPEMRLAVSWEAGLVGVVADLLDGGTIEDRRAELQAKPCSGPSENSLVDLSEVHS